jgi:hypothetical protein
LEQVEAEVEVDEGRRTTAVEVQVAQELESKDSSRPHPSEQPRRSLSAPAVRVEPDEAPMALATTDRMGATQTSALGLRPSEAMLAVEVGQRVVRLELLRTTPQITAVRGESAMTRSRALQALAPRALAAAVAVAA